MKLVTSGVIYRLFKNEDENTIIRKANVRRIAIQLNVKHTVSARMIFLDKDEFISHIRELVNDPILKKNGLKIAEDGIVEVNSKNHLPLQFMDLILGAICFKLNEKDKLKVEGENKVGKRTIVKLKLYKHINSRIREIYPNFNIGVTTPIRIPSDSWTQVYRHWSFIPKYHIRDTSRTKKAKK